MKSQYNAKFGFQDFAGFGALWKVDSGGTQENTQYSIFDDFSS